MTGNVQSYDNSTADQAHGDINSVIGGLESSLSDLGGFVNAVKSNWSGDEMVQYTGIQQKWDGAADEVRSILKSIHAALADNTLSVQEMRGAVNGALSA